MDFSTDFSNNIQHFKTTLHVEECFDVVYRVVEIGGRKGCLFFVDGMTKDEVLLKILPIFQAMKPEDMPQDAHGFSKRCIPYGEIGLVSKEADAVIQLLSGMTCLFIEGYDKCLTIDCRTYPARGVGEPEKDKVMRGSRDGFVETPCLKGRNFVITAVAY